MVKIAYNESKNKYTDPLYQWSGLSYSHDLYCLKLLRIKFYGVSSLFTIPSSSLKLLYSDLASLYNHLIY